MEGLGRIHLKAAEEDRSRLQQLAVDLVAVGRDMVGKSAPIPGRVLNRG